MPEVNWRDSQSNCLSVFLPEGQGRGGEVVYRRVWRLVPYSLFLLMSFSFLLLRSFELQIVRGQELLLASEENRYRRQVIWAERGIIYDEGGRTLARNRPGYRVSLNLNFLLPEDFESHLFEIASALSLDLSDTLGDVRKAIASDNRQVTLKSGLSQDEALKLAVDSVRWPELLIEIEPLRDYLYGPLLAQSLGYVSEADGEDLAKISGEIYGGEKIGKTGLEAIYDSHLRGEVGAQIIETSAQGRSERLVAQSKPVPGKSLVTSFNLALQEKSVAILKDSLEKYQGTGGVVVAQKPETGEVLALVSLPSYDPNLFTQNTPDQEEKLAEIFTDPQSPLSNRAISGLYPPASTFKLVTAAAVLEEGVFEPTTLINDEGFIRVGDFTFNDWKPGGHGLISMVRAISVSCDTYFYIVGGGYQSYPGVGVEKLAFWARKVGYGQKTLIDLDAEEGGLIPDPSWKERVKGEPWYIGNTYHMAIGQGDVLATPLQMNNYTNFLANGHHLWQPFIVKKALSPDGYVVWQTSPRSLANDLLSSQTLDILRQGAHEATLAGGTAFYAFQSSTYSSAGKTGTAEYGDPDRGRTHAWYTAYAPYESPVVSLTVLVEGGGEGSVAAALTARQILDWYFKEASVAAKP